MLFPGSSTRLQKDGDRKSTRLNSSHLGISYAVFCLKKKRLTVPTACVADGVRMLTAAYVGESGQSPYIMGCPLPAAKPTAHPFFFFNDTATTEISPLSLPDALPISGARDLSRRPDRGGAAADARPRAALGLGRSEEHTSELQSRSDLVCRLLLE